MHVFVSRISSRDLLEHALELEKFMSKKRSVWRTDGHCREGASDEMRNMKNENRERILGGNKDGYVLTGVWIHVYTYHRGLVSSLKFYLR